MKKKDKKILLLNFLMDFSVMQAHFPWPSLSPVEACCHGGYETASGLKQNGHISM